MKKVLFTVFFMLSVFYNSAHAVVCVPSDIVPAPTNKTKYLQIFENSYALCNGKRGTFENCPLNTIAEGWDGRLHKCTKNGWTQIDMDQIQTCTGSLDQIEDLHDNNSNLGILVANDYAQQDWIIYLNYTNDGNFIGVQDGTYCKFRQTEYDELLNNCLTIQKGDFLYWDTENKKTILCETKYNPQEQSIITVKDVNSNPLSNVQVIYSDINHDGTPILTGENGQATLEYNAKAQKQIVTFRKEGFSDVNKIISAVRKNPNIIMVAIQPDDDENDDDKVVEIEPKEPTEEPVVEPVVDEEPPAPKSTPEELEQKLKSAQDALTKAKDAENSWANRGVTAASSAMTGLGGMAAASALAEQRADAEAEKQMRAYIETMKCEYGNGQNVKLGNEEITLPGGNELLDYYTEYKQLADNLKTTKSALGLRSGIESEVLYDRAQSGLYQYASIGKTGGAETSLYRALTDKESGDASAWAEQKEKSAKQLKTGGLVAAAGVATGVIGNYLVNERGKTKLQQKTDDVIEEIEERLPAFTYTPQTVVIQNPEEQKPTIYLGENNGRMQMPKLTNLSPRTKELTLNGDTTFARNNDKIKSDGTKKIDTFVTELKPILEKMSDEQKIQINIVGHTDRTGNDKINIPLSRRRAESVEKYLKDPNRLGGNAYKTKIEYSTDGKGSTECAENTCGNKKDCELCRKVVVTIEDISPKIEETE